MRYSKTGKPVCFAHGCRRIAAWFFSYSSMGKPARAYYCEMCARERGYSVCRQPLQHLI